MTISDIPLKQRAWTWRKSSSPRNLVAGEVPLPRLEPNEVLIRNEVAALNPVDWKVLGGLPTWRDGHVPGVDGAGVVVDAGDPALSGWIGTRVAYHQNLNKGGSFAEYTAIAARALMRVSEGLELSLAASLPCPALTAWLALDKLPLRPGAELLVTGAGGAVGNYIVQLAIQRGFVVTAMCNQRHWDRLRDLGVHATIPGPIADEAELQEEWLGRFFAVIDTVSGNHALLLSKALEANGHMVCVQDRLPAWPSEPFGRCLSIHEVALGALHVFGTDAAWSRLTAAGEQIMQQLSGGSLRPEPLVTTPFAELPQALEELRSRNFSGKPLIKVN